MKTNQKREKTAFITGVNCALGRAYADYFAKSGYHLILTGSEAEAVTAAAKKLERTYAVSITAILSDLSQRRGLNELQKNVDFSAIDVLVNVADSEKRPGLSHVFRGDVKRRMFVQMNSAVFLTLAMLRKMLVRNEGIIINVSSEGISLPAPGSGNSASSRIFIRQFTEGLHEELQDTKVIVQAVCPGLFSTEEECDSAKAQIRQKGTGFLRLMDAETVVLSAMHDLHKGKVFSSPGWRSKWLAASSEEMDEKNSADTCRIS